MNIYLFDIGLAALTFIVLSWHFAIFYMVIQYRKHGSVSKVRTLIHASFGLYILCAYFLIIMPLPDPAALEPFQGITHYMNLIPLRFIHDFILGTSLSLVNIHTFIPALREPVFFQPAFNILLTIPFGIYLSYYFRQNFKKTVLFTFLLSLFFELTQLTALYGIYPSPYRLFDVDDLLLNTLGGALGFFIYKHILFFLPSREKIDADSLKRSDKVGYIRRFIAFFIDHKIALLLSTVILGFFNVDGMAHLILSGFILYFYFIVSLLIFKQTPGKSLVRIKLQQENENWSYSASVLCRYAILILTISIYNILVWLVANTYANAIYALLQLCLMTAVFLDLLISLKRSKVLFYEKMSKMRNVSTKIERPISDIL